MEIETVDSGIIISLIPLPSNIPSAIFFSLEFKFTIDNSLQFLKAYFSIEFTLSGILISANFVLEKADCSIVVTEYGNSSLVNAEL